MTAAPGAWSAISRRPSPTSLINTAHNLSMYEKPAEQRSDAIREPAAGAQAA
jgi:hypothetical protein